jgi:uncharacterized OsmC-like protein
MGAVVDSAELRGVQQPLKAVSKDAPVGFRPIRLVFDLDTDASAEQVQTLLRLTERYCVVYQTLAHPARLSVSAPA